MATQIFTVKRTRHERKLAHAVDYAAAAREREAYKRLHPVSCGVIPLVDYVPPAGRYVPAPRVFANGAVGLTAG